MDLADYLFKKACLMCENHAENFVCEDKKACPVYGLYIEATNKTKKKIVYRREWETPPTPINEII